MSNSLIKKLTVIFLFSIVFYRCSDDNVAGGGMDVANGYVSGVIVASSDSSNNNIIVKLVPEKYNPTNQSIPDTLIDTTDITGNFNIGPVDSGSYNIVSKTFNNSHMGFINGLKVDGFNVSISDTIDSAFNLSIILPDSLYGTSAELFIEGTDLLFTVPDSIDTLRIYLPKDSLPSLLINISDSLASDTIIPVIPTEDSLIDLSNNDSNYDTIGVYTHWSNIGVATDTASQVIIDSNDNIWVLFNSQLVCLLPESTGEITKGPVIYSKNDFSDSINEITFATISPIGELWFGTDGMGIYRRIINTNGLLTGAGALKDNIYFYMISDTVSSIDFIDSTILVGSPGGFGYGNYYLNNSSTVIESAPNEAFVNTHFFGSEDVFCIVDSALENYEIIDSSITTTPFGFSLGSDKVIEMKQIDNNTIHLYFLCPSSGRKVAIFNQKSQSLKEYSLPAIDISTYVTSSIVDLDGNEWFGLSDGSIIKIIGNNENNYKIFDFQNSNLLNDTEEINAMTITKQNRLLATQGKTGFFLLDLKPIR